MNKGTMPIKTWITWSVLALGAFLVLTWNYFVEGFRTDTSRISILLLAFFVYGFISSLLAAIKLQREFKGLSYLIDHMACESNPVSEVGQLFAKVQGKLQKGGRVNFNNLATAYGAKLGVRSRNVSVVSGMLITIGLLGTVVGLIITVNGLSDVLEAAGKDSRLLLEGMNQTVEGMGTAFYTTFFGALLGGVVLRVLSSELDKSNSQLAAETLELGELWAVQDVESASDVLEKLESKVQVLSENLETLGAGLSSVSGLVDAKRVELQESLNGMVSATEKSMAEMLEKGIASMGEGFSSISQSLEQGQQPLVEGLDRLSEEVGRAAKETRRQSEISLQTQTSDIARKLNDAANMLKSIGVTDDEA